ncbi:ABC transporter ATP-binding protein [Paenibacillus sp. A3]|uniref:ABC transporter ATP-binding protein n=1 Tax=Paenibacillus sp. A3 TaxID=1337054 RepID=UPI0012FA0EE8|nr:ABC transporter ATP-binding protein [Paenibacillus sp. A3]
MIFIKEKNYLIRIFLDSKKQWLLMCKLSLTLLIIAVLGSYSATLFGNMVDFGILGNISKIYKLLFIIIFLAIIKSSLNIVHSVVARIIVEKIVLHFRGRAFAVLSNIKIPVLEKKLRSGDLSTRLNSDLESLSDLLSIILNWYLWVIVYALVGFISCFLLNWKVSISYFIIVPIFIFLTQYISKPIEKQQKSLADNLGLAMNIATESIKSNEVVKSFKAENYINNKYSQYIDESISSNKLSAKIGMKMTMIKYITSLLLLLSLFFIGVFFISANIITVGQFITFVILSANVRTAIELTDSMIKTARQGTALSKRLYEFLDLELETNYEILSDENILTDDCICIKNLKFGYSDSNNIFENISLKVKHGQKIGLIGSSGSGKSSIIKLICKFYEHQSGELIFLGKDIKNWSLNELRKHLSIVTQEPYLFDGTIYENVLYGNEEATEEEIINALKEAQLWDFVQSLEKGLNSYIGESGSHLSGGQKQRLSIARAIIKNAPIILLDEPTSSLDTQSEILVQKALNRLLANKTAIIISHRYSTLKNVDYIYFLDKGKIIEEGIPELLFRKKGYFYDFKAVQEN